MSTSYEQGVKDGTWTASRLQRFGLPPQWALRAAEKSYQDDIAWLAALGPDDSDFVQDEVERLEGYITAARRSLRVLITTYVEEFSL